ncbi:MAG TPA: hypothetical protein VND70_05155 [Acidimicrobiales bacterium]|nr:hypothetical protein [Acidimicrobiales bacterium]
MILAILVCVVAPISLISIHVHENPRFSPIDEAVQYDYVNRVAGGSVPRLGQLLLPASVHVISCRGVAANGPPLKCPGTGKPDTYPGGPYQYEAQQPPTYYAATVPLRWLGVHVFGMDGVTAARTTGGLWVATALLLLWMTGRMLGLPVRKIVPPILLLASAPTVVYQSSIVSNDAPALFAGALVAFLGILAWKRPGRWTFPTLFVGGVLVTSFKLDDALCVVVVAGVLGIVGWSEVRSQSSETVPKWGTWLSNWTPTGGALVLGCTACAVGWIIANRELSLINPKTLSSFAALRTGPVGLTLIARESLSMLNPLAGSYAPFRTNAIGTPAGTFDSLNLQPITATLTEYLFLAVGLTGIFVTPRRWPHWLGLLSLLVLYVGGIVLGFGVWHTYSADPSVGGRYGLCVAPLLALALASIVRSWGAVVGLWVFSIATVGLTYFYLLAA